MLVSSKVLTVVTDPVYEILPSGHFTCSFEGEGDITDVSSDPVVYIHCHDPAIVYYVTGNVNMGDKVYVKGQFHINTEVDSMLCDNDYKDEDDEDFFGEDHVCPMLLFSMDCLLISKELADDAFYDPLDPDTNVVETVSLARHDMVQFQRVFEVLLVETLLLGEKNELIGNVARERKWKVMNFYQKTKDSLDEKERLVYHHPTKYFLAKADMTKFKELCEKGD